MSEDAIFGIGGVGQFEENEAPMVPSEAALKRYERMLATEVICRYCGASSLDGAMFTTLGGNICDDCAG